MISSSQPRILIPLKALTTALSRLILIALLTSTTFFSPTLLAKEVEKKPHKITKKTTPPSPTSDSQRFDDLKTTVGSIWRCENNIVVKTAESAQGYLMLWNNRLFVMSKIEALTGVQRYMHEQASLNWVEIPDKAMLFNTKMGQRVLDYCKTPELATQSLSTNQEDLLR